MLRILSSGPLSLVQDLGRYGYQNVGVTTGGPMDEHAYLWANRLLNNSPNDPQIEITLGQFHAEFTKPTMIAITGADMSPSINDIPIKIWQSYFVNVGDKIKLGNAKTGLRCYLAIKNGFKIQAILNSCSTVIRDRLGGLEKNGKKLNDGDLLNYSETSNQIINRVPEKFIPNYSQHPQSLFVIPSYQYELFPKDQQSIFFNSIYTVSPQIDRMGYRLSGEKIKCSQPGIISEGIALGAIQIPADGQPIVLMRDRQTIGGYPKIGCLTNESVCRLAQCQPGSKVRFILKDLFQAEAEFSIESIFLKLNHGK